MDSERLQKLLRMLDDVDACWTDVMCAREGDEAPAHDLSESIETMRDELQEAWLDAVRREVA